MNLMQEARKLLLLMKAIRHCDDTSVFRRGDLCDHQDGTNYNTR